MALTRITKGVIKPNENYDTHNIVSTGIVTAIGLDINGNGDVSGDLNVGGVLTYEDVTSIDSVGLITARNGIDCNGDLDVDGHTNLDNVSIAGVSTFSGGVKFDGSIGVGIANPSQKIHIDGGNLIISNSTQSGSSAPQIRLNSSSSDGSSTRFMFGLATGSNHFINGSASNDSCFSAPSNMLFGIGNTRKFRIKTSDVLTDVDFIPSANDATSLGRSNARWSDLYSVDANISGDLNVDGQTNLDHVSIAGVTTTSDCITIVSNRNTLINLSNSANYHLHLTNPNNDLNETVGIAFGLSTGGDIGAAITHEREGSTSFGNLRFYTKENNNPATMLERMRISKEGKVGIGTDNPQEILHVLQSGTTAAEFRLENNEGYLLVRADNNIATYGAQQHLFHNRANSTEYLRIDSDGDVIIGTTSWQYKKPLNVQGSSGHILSLYNGDTGTYAENTLSGIELKLRTGNTGNQFGSCEIRAFKENGTNGDSARALSFYTGVNGGSPTERLRITSGGNVGINESPTIAQFQVKSAQLGGTSGNTQEVVRLHSPDVSNTTSYRFTNYRTSNGTSHVTSEMRFRRHVDATDMGYFGLGDGYASIGYGTAEKFRITSSGLVGIGTISPNAVLHVEKNGTNQVLARFESNMGTNNNRALSLTSPTSDSGSLPFTFSTGNSIEFKCDNHIGLHIDDNGQVGINTNDPQEGLHVHEGHIVVGQDSGNGTNIRNYIKFGRVSAPKAAIGFINTTGNSRGDILFMNSNASNTNEFSNTDEIVRFTREGKVGIGTNNPAELLDVYKTSNDAVIKTRTTGAGAYFDADSASSGFYGLRLKSSGTDKWFLGSYDSAKFTIKDGSGFNGTERFTILDTSGKVGITSTSPTGALDIRTGDHGFDGFIKLTKDENYNPSIEYYRTTGSGPTWYGAQLRLMTGDFTYSYAGSATLGNHSYSEFVRITQHGKVGISTSIANAKLEIGNVTGGYMNTSGIQVNRPHSLGLLNGIHVYTDAGYNPTASYRTAAFKATGTSGHAFACSTDAGSNGQGGTLNAKIDFDGDAHFLDGLGVGTATRSDGAKMEVFARGDTERGIYITDSDTTHNSPYLRVLGKRGDGNTHQSFSGRILLASLRTNAKINSGRKVGVIMFGGNHTNTSESNILYPASIAAVAGGSYDSATDMPTDLVFYTGSTGRAPNTNNVSSGDERLRIQSGGNVEMAQDVRLVSLPNSGNGAGLKVGGNGYGGDNTYGSMAVTNGNLHLDARNGSYGIYLNWYGGANGTYFGNGSSGQRGRIDGAGNLTLSGSYPGSDLRLKENIQNISGATDTIKSLVGKTFTWKTEAGLDDWKHYGFIAQEVQKVAPDLVKSIGCHYFDKDDKLVTDIDPTESDEDRKNKGITQSLTVNNEGVTPILVEAMKELIAKVETLEAKVSALEGS